MIEPRNTRGPAAEVERPLLVQSGDLRQDARERARRAESRPHILTRGFQLRFRVVIRPRQNSDQANLSTHPCRG
jgi:hypothetical protein